MLSSTHITAGYCTGLAACLLADILNITRTSALPKSRNTFPWASRRRTQRSLFAFNGTIAILIDLLLGLRITSGIFIGWTMYLVMTEEIHWRIHMDGWLPPGLRFARAYHMQHHDLPNGRYNVFLPLFDFLFGNSGSARRSQRLALLTADPADRHPISITLQDISRSEASNRHLRRVRQGRGVAVLSEIVFRDLRTFDARSA